MHDSFATPARDYAPGIGDAVADRTINRTLRTPLAWPRSVVLSLPRQDDTSLDSEVAAYARREGLETNGYTVEHGDGQTVEVTLNVVAESRKEIWADVAHRVAVGNTLLRPQDAEFEFHPLHHHLRQGSLLMSGRHLQHGDDTQPSRPQEVFTNCSTSAASFLTFYLLLNGSGVGRAYDNAMMMVDYSKMPIIVPVLEMMHPDSLSGEIKVMTPRDAKHLYRGSDTETFVVPDSREGWAKAIEVIDTLTFQGKTDTVLLLDFSKVRCKGSPIQGMQNRPASGPGPVMDAISNLSRLRGCNMALWRQAMYADHYLAECVLVGGARRAARMATKTWRDHDVIDFVHIKRPLEYLGLEADEIIEYQKTHGQPMGFLWSSNNSVTVDEEFWELVKMPEDQGVGLSTDRYHLWKHANAVLHAAAEASYYDGTGEPGLINQERLTQVDEGFSEYADGEFAGSERYQLEEGTKPLMRQLAEAAIASPFKMITNPCGEITLVMLGAYCVIADTVPYLAGSRHKVQTAMGDFSGWDADAVDSFRVATRALIRTNLMDCLYRREVNRTNRIGVGMTGLHEYAYARFGHSWHTLVDEEKSKDFWLMLSQFKRAVQDEARDYAQKLGVAVPHTDTTMKPAGTTSKLFGLTEGAHLPSMREYLRWVQFRHDDPIVRQYKDLGYPVRELKSYSGTTIVGFPTRPEIAQLGMGDALVTAAEATPWEQYEYLRLLEKYWITGVEEDGVTPLRETGNQVSYTLKYLPGEVSFEEFKRTLIDGQSSIRCCSVMPQGDTSAYEYQPEQPLPKGEYEKIVSALKSQDTKEDVAFEHIDCGAGGCPIDFNGQ